MGSLEPVSPTHTVVPINDGWVDSRIPEIARWLVNQDPNLTLVARGNQLGIIEEYDLYSRGHWLASWSPGEVHLIKSDFMLMKARIDRPSANKSLARSIRDSRDKQEKAARAQVHDAYAEAVEHFAFLANDTRGPRNRFFQMPGFKEGNSGTPTPPDEATS